MHTSFALVSPRGSAAAPDESGPASAAQVLVPSTAIAETSAKLRIARFVVWSIGLGSSKCNWAESGRASAVVAPPVVRRLLALPAALVLERFLLALGLGGTRPIRTGDCLLEETHVSLALRRHMHPQYMRTRASKHARETLEHSFGTSTSRRLSR